MYLTILDRSKTLFYFKTLNNMKKITIILMIYAFTFQTNAQELNTVELINSLMQVEAITKYKKFRKDFEKTVTELTENEKLKNNTEQYNKLRAAYNSTKKEYDAFLVIVKSDMSDFYAIKQMTKKPEKFAQKYMNAYTKAINNYETNFVPVYNEINNSRAVSVVFVKLAIKGFIIIVDYIKKRKQNKTESYNYVLSQTNDLFFDKLKLKEWNEIVTYSPSAKTAGTSEFANIENETYVPHPTAKNMLGRIEFVSVTNRNPLQTETMLFKQKHEERDLIIGELNEKTDYSGDYFISQNTFPEKTAFQIKVTNSAFLYVFAFNSDNKCYNIYPFSKEWVKAYDMGRDLSVGGLPGKDDFSNQTIIPSKSKNGQENYIIISGNAQKEQLCIIVSKSELDIQDVYNKINNMKGNIYERINAVFSENIISADKALLNIDEGTISFNAQDNEKTVLPLIFYIKR